MNKYQAISWLLTPDEQQPLPNDGVIKYELPMLEGNCPGKFEIISPEQSRLWLSRGRHSFSEDIKDKLVQSGEHQAVLDEPELMISSAYSGQILLDDQQAGKKIAFGGTQTLFHHMEYYDFAPSFYSHTPIDVRLLRIPLTELSLLLGEETATKLLAQLRMSSTNTVETFSIPAHISALLYAAQSNHFTGKMHQTFVVSKTFEYLCRLAEHICPQPQANTPIATKIDQIYEELLYLEGKLPSLQELAHRYHISASAISQGFKKQYGKSLYHFVTEQRLIQAHTVIQETDVAIKSLAFRLGYAHVANFTAAFTRQFGYAPGSLRKKCFNLD